MFETRLIQTQSQPHIAVPNKTGPMESLNVTPQHLNENSIDKAAIEIIEKNLQNIYRRGSVTSSFMNPDSAMHRHLNQRNFSVPNIHQINNQQ